jgi:pimeloyl-ACP methyl ester carboxylesterase
MRLNHVREGHGPTLVLIHGLGSHLHAWDPVRSRLAAERDVIALDLPGFGESPPLPADVTPTAAALANAVATLFDDLGLERPHVAGNSLGGWVALELARLGRAASLTLVSPGGFWSEGERRFATLSLRVTRWLARTFAGAMPRLLASATGRRVVMGQIFAHPERIPAAAAIADARAFARAPGFDATFAVAARPGNGFRGQAEVTCPVTIAWGDRDYLLPPRQGRRAAAQLAGARLVPLVGCGHTPTWDDPELVTRVLLDGSAAGAAASA